MESQHCLCLVNKKGIGGNISGTLQSANLATKLSEQQTQPEQAAELTFPQLGRVFFL
jgi:hypothetical protein